MSLLGLARVIAEAGTEVRQRFSQAVIELLEANGKFVADRTLLEETLNEASLNNECRLEVTQQLVTTLAQECPKMSKDEFVVVVLENCGLKEQLSHDVERLWRRAGTACSAILTEAGKAGSVSEEQALAVLLEISTHAVFCQEDLETLEWFCRGVQTVDKLSGTDEVRLSQIRSQMRDWQRFRELVPGKVAG